MRPFVLANTRLLLPLGTRHLQSQGLSTTSEGRCLLLSHSDNVWVLFSFYDRGITLVFTSEGNYKD